MRFDILTIFPQIITSYINQGVIGRAHSLKKVLDIKVHNIRDYSLNSQRKVDDSPFGGGAGMIMQIEPIYNNLLSIFENSPNTKKYTILTKAGAPLFTQTKAMALAQDYNHLILICGRYEGIDHRVEECLVNEAISIGEFVLSGGELPALTILDAVARHIPEVLGNQQSLEEESWTKQTELEYPQYSRPATFIPSNPNLVKTSPPEWTVPEVLLSGNHQQISTWRAKHKK